MSLAAHSRKRLVVTGGAGFIGSHVIERCLQSGWDVLAIDDFSTGVRHNLAMAAEVLEADVSSPEARTAIIAFAPDAIVHAAAQASVPRSVEDPLHDANTNILGGIATARAAVAAGASAFVYLTTGGAIYGRSNAVPTNEDGITDPIAPYGVSKLALEMYLPALLPRDHVRILRLSNVYGPRQQEHTEGAVIPAFVNGMLRGDPIVIHGDGAQTRDFVHVQDVVEAIERALVVRGPYTLNIGTGCETSILDLFHIIAGLTHYQLPPQFAPRRPADVQRSALSIEQARTILGWSPGISISQGIPPLIDERMR